MKKISKTFARFLALTLIAVMLLSAFAACKKSEKAADTIVGKWTADIDFSSFMQKIFAEQGSSSEFPIDLSDIDLSGMIMKVSYEFNEDGTYKSAADEESSKNVMNKLGQAMAEVFKKAFAAEGSEISDELFLAMMGLTSWDEFGAEMMKDEDGNPVDFGGFTGEGKYAIEDGKLVMTNDKGEKQTAEYTLSGSELKFTSLESDDMSDKDKEQMKSLFPIVFKKG